MGSSPQPIPAGSTVQPIGSGAGTAVPIPEGATVAPLGAPKSATEQMQTPEEREDQYEASNPTFSQRLAHSYEQVKGGVKGFVKSAGQTLAPVLDYAAGGPSALALHAAGIESPNRGKVDKALEIHGNDEMGGALAENIMEFMVGDEALKALSWADKASQVIKLSKLA